MQILKTLESYIDTSYSYHSFLFNLAETTSYGFIVIISIFLFVLPYLIFKFTSCRNYANCVERTVLIIPVVILVPFLIPMLLLVFVLHKIKDKRIFLLNSFIIVGATIIAPFLIPVFLFSFIFYELKEIRNTKT